MLGGYLEFFMKPATAEMYQSLRKELEELIQNKVSDAFKKSHLFSIHNQKPLVQMFFLFTFVFCAVIL